MTAVAPNLERRVPPLGGFNVTFVRLEIRRMLRNRRTAIFTLIMPVAFYFDGTTATDPEMKGIRSATVAYTFVRAKGGVTTTPLAAVAATAAQDVAVNARVTFSADPAR